MGAIASLSETTLLVEPGGEVVTTITVQNTGTVVDSFVVEPLGPAAPWAIAEPPTLSLFPGASETAVVRFRPPRLPDTPVGLVPFALRVRSSEDPDGSVVEEGALDVGRFAATTAELLPRTSRARGRRAGRHQLAIDNRGNARVNVAVTAVDADNRLRFALPQPGLVAEPGQAAYLPLMVRSRSRFWRGPAVTHPFQVLLEPEGEPPLVVEGTMLQEAVLPRWLAWLLAGLLFLIAALIALYLAVLRPAIRSDAKEAAREEAKKVAEQAGGAAGAAAGDKAGKDAVAGPIAEAQRQLDTIADALKTTLPPISSATPAPFAEDPTLGRSLTARLAVNGGGTQTATRTFGDDEAFSLTDLIFQNPAGDRGLLQVFRGDDLLFSSRLENFRDLDEHFVAPFVFEPGQKLRLVVNCENVAPAAANCTAGVTFGGFVRTPQPTPSAAPTP